MCPSYLSIEGAELQISSAFRILYKVNGLMLIFSALVFCTTDVYDIHRRRMRANFGWVFGLFVTCFPSLSSFLGT